jgi:peptidoglycan hydrolase CwlO-like protein
MKRVFILSAIPILLLRLPVTAQDAASTPARTAAAIAAKEDAEERYKRLAADLQAVQSDNEALHAKITALEEEIQTLRAAQARPADNSAIQDELKRLAQTIQEVDNKRQNDKEVISEEIRKSIGGLEQSLRSAPAPAHVSGAKPSAVPDSPASDKGYSYTIQEGDTLAAVVNAYNADFKSKGMKTITLKQAKEANPNVDWNRLRVGQKIVIPRPDGG